VLSALTQQSIDQLKPALTAVPVYAPLLTVCLDQAAAREPSIAVAELRQDLSPWGMVLHADQIVKAVMIGLEREQTGYAGRLCRIESRLRERARERSRTNPLMPLPAARQKAA
jgi:hypothetical protein